MKRRKGEKSTTSTHRQVVKPGLGSRRIVAYLDFHLQSVFFGGGGVSNGVSKRVVKQHVLCPFELGTFELGTNKHSSKEASLNVSSHIRRCFQTFALCPWYGLSSGTPRSGSNYSLHASANWCATSWQDASYGRRHRYRVAPAGQRPALLAWCWAQSPSNRRGGLGHFRPN